MTHLGGDAPLAVGLQPLRGHRGDRRSPEVVLLRGNVLVENDELVASPGIGQFVKRAKFGEELQPADAPSLASASAGSRGRPSTSPGRASAT